MDTHAIEMAIEVGGTHPTGMHSCSTADCFPTLCNRSSKYDTEASLQRDLTKILMTKDITRIPKTLGVYNKFCLPYLWNSYCFSDSQANKTAAPIA